MNVAFFVKNGQGYSGGRYHAWMMAESLSVLGNKVTIITNRAPEFIGDFTDYSGHNTIEIFNSPFFKPPKRIRFDIVVVVPDRSSPRSLYLQAKLKAAKDKARLILVNFETPNWFNEFASEPQSYELWQYWLEIAEDTDLILSISKEGTKYAKKYYKYKHLQFKECYPSINSIIADQFSNIKKIKQIIYISTVAPHKNYDYLKEILSKQFSGYRLLWVEGTGKIDDKTLVNYQNLAKRNGMIFEVKSKVSDIEKYFEISRSKAMVFFSSFEGFGLPPVEAQYCNTPCVAFDLPVLKEISNGGVVLVSQGDIEQFKKKLTSVLAKNHKNLRINIRSVASFENYTKRLKKILEQTKKTSKPLTRRIEIELKEELREKVIRYYVRQTFLKLLGISNRVYRLTRKLEYGIYEFNRITGIHAFKKKLLKSDKKRRLYSGNNLKLKQAASYLGTYFAPKDTWLANNKNLHKGERCFILGCGPSLNKTYLKKLKHEVTFGVNGTYMIDDFASTYYVMISENYWKFHIDGVKNVRCKRRFIPMDTRLRLESNATTSWINFRRPVYSVFNKQLPVPARFSYNADTVLYGGGTVLFVCLQLAYHMGFETAILLGVDHDYGLEYDETHITITNVDRAHFRPDYVPPGSKMHVDLESMERAYQLARDAFDRDGRTILNASPGTKLDTYPKVKYNSLF